MRCVELHLGELRSLKTRGGKEAYTELTVRFPLSAKTLDGVASFVADCQARGIPVNVTIQVAQLALDVEAGS